MDNPSLIRVLLSDDQQLLLKMYRAFLSGEGFEIAGECKTPEETVESYKRLLPQVVLIDIRYGTIQTGFDAIKQIMSFDSKANVVVISQYDVSSYIALAYKLGVKAFLSKNCLPETVQLAIKAASRGEIYHSPEITKKVMEHLSQPEPDPTVLLNAKDLDIFLKIAEGMTNAEIAAETGYTISFVVTHRLKIQETLGIDKAVQYSRLAIRLGLIQA